ncbi:MAG: hypothetical protein ABGW81_04930 [Paracoccaceae bacterium]
MTSAEQLRELGADEGYRLALENGIRLHFIGYYALVMDLRAARVVIVRTLKRRTCVRNSI